MGAQGQLTRGSNGLSPGTKYKRSKIALDVTSIANSNSYILRNFRTNECFAICDFPQSMSQISPVFVHFKKLGKGAASHIMVFLRVSSVPDPMTHDSQANGFCTGLEWQFVYSVPVSACICVFVSVQVSVFVSLCILYLHTRSARTPQFPAQYVV